MDYYKLLLTCLFFLLGQGCVWFCSSAQLVWVWWAGKPLQAAICFGIPGSVAFWHGTKHGFEAMGELWGPRFIGFGMSYVTFPILTWWFLNESMFTPKTLVCAGLSFLIVAIQFFWKTA